MLSLTVLQVTKFYLTINVVNFEKKENFFAVGLMRSILVHRVQELGQGDLVVAILVEDFEHTLNKKGLLE